MGSVPLMYCYGKQPDGSWYLYAKVPVKAGALDRVKQMMPHVKEWVTKDGPWIQEGVKISE